MYYLLIILGGALTIFVAYNAYITRARINIGIDIAKNTVPFSREMQDAKTRILFIGDSSAVGVGANTPEESVAGRMGAEFPDADVVNLGVNGAKTNEIISRLEEITDEEFDTVVVHTGGNDIVRFTDLNTVRKDLNRVLDLADKIGDQVILIHGADMDTARLLPWGTRWVFQRRYLKYRDIAIEATLDRRNVGYVDLYGAEDNIFRSNTKQVFSADSFHPSSEGYAVWYRALSDEMKRDGVLRN